MTKTFYVQDVASEYVSGKFITETEIDQWILDDLLDKYCYEASNTCGSTDVYVGNKMISDGETYEFESQTPEDNLIEDLGDWVAREIIGLKVVNIFTSGGHFGTENEQRVTNALQKLIANTTPEEREEMVTTLQKFHSLSAA